MESDGGNVADAGVREPLEGLVQCEGIPRKSWMTKCVAVQNDADVVVGKGICHNVDLASSLIVTTHLLEMIVSQFKLPSPYQSVTYPPTGCSN